MNYILIAIVSLFSNGQDGFYSTLSNKPLPVQLKALESRLKFASRPDSRIDATQASKKYLSTGGYTPKKSQWLIKLAARSKSDDFKRIILDTTSSQCVENITLCMNNFDVSTNNFDGPLSEHMVKLFLNVLVTDNFDLILKNQKKIAHIFSRALTDKKLQEQLAHVHVRFGFSSVAPNFFSKNKISENSPKWLRYSYCSNLTLLNKLKEAEQCYSGVNEPWFKIQSLYVKKLTGKSVNIEAPEIKQLLKNLMSSKNEKINNHIILMKEFLSSSLKQTVIDEQRMNHLANDYENGFLFYLKYSKNNLIPKKALEKFKTQYTKNFPSKLLSSGMTNKKVQKDIKSALGKNNFLVRGAQL